MTTTDICTQAIQDVQAAMLPLRDFLEAKSGDVYDWALDVERQSDRQFIGRERTAYLCALIEEGKETRK